MTEANEGTSKQTTEKKHLPSMEQPFSHHFFLFRLAGTYATYIYELNFFVLVEIYRFGEELQTKCTLQSCGLEHLQHPSVSSPIEGKGRVLKVCCYLLKG